VIYNLLFFCIGNESSQSKKRGEGRQEKNAAMSTTQAPMVQEPDANLG